MKEITVFTNSEFGAVRTLTVNGDPYFVGKDVADILGYRNGSRDINRHVDQEDRQKTMVFDGNQNKETIIINESGLHSLILGSKLPSAKRFKHWVTSEVLPAIRKHGLYALDDVLNDPDTLIRALTALKEERAAKKALETQVAVQSQQIAEMTPKATYYDAVLKCKNVLPITIIAKDYGWSGSKMNKFLKEMGVQFKMGTTWLLYQKYADKGYTKTVTFVHKTREGEERTSVSTYWTQSGRLFIYDLMKKSGNLPIIEQK